MWGSSLIYNTSARNERHERHKYDMSATQATRVRLEQYKCKASATQVLHKWHKCNTSATRVKNIEFDNDTSKNIFSHPCIYYTENERLQGEKQFHFKNYLFAKMSLKSASQKRSILMIKAASKKFVAASL